MSSGAGPVEGTGPVTASAPVSSIDASAQPVSDATTIAALSSFESVSVQYDKDQRAVLTLNALNSLARILGGLPGRKNLIWVTGDLPFAFVPEDQTMTDAERMEDQPSFNTRR